MLPHSSAKSSGYIPVFCRYLMVSQTKIDMIIVARSKAGVKVKVKVRLGFGSQPVNIVFS